MAHSSETCLTDHNEGSISSHMAVQDQLAEYRKSKAVTYHKENRVRFFAKKVVWYCALPFTPIFKVLMYCEDKISQLGKKLLTGTAADNLPQGPTPGQSIRSEVTVSDANNTADGATWTKEHLLILGLKVLLWLCLWGMFISLEFGAVFVAVSGLYFMYRNLGTKSAGAPSAYSVFNPNCERLTGTFSGDDYDKQLRGKTKIF